MKIGFDAKRAFNNSTGLGNHSRILLNAMMRDHPDYQYLLFSPRVNDEYFQQLHGKFELVLPATKFQKSFHPLWRSYGITKQLEAKHIALYHGLSNELPMNIHHSKIKRVVTIHDLIFLKHTEQYAWFDRQFYERKTKYAAKHAHKIIAVSNETKHDLINFYKVPANKIEVIYPSVDPMFYNSVEPVKLEEIRKKYTLPEKYILNVGSFFPRKNQLSLLEAFDLVKDQISEHLVLAGNSGNRMVRLQQIIEAKKLQGRVHIVSNISNDDLPSVFQSASLFVFPSFFEGFGAPVLEALFSKIPVIASKGGAIEEAGGKGSLYIDPNSAADIAEKILQVLKSESLQRKMIHEGLLHSQTLTDTVFAQKTIRVYQSLL